MPDERKAQEGHLIRDPAYDTVHRDDFRAMVEVERYDRRSDDFDEIISATHDHFWDPNDPAYVDFDQPFDLQREYLMPPERIQELRGAVLDRLDEGDQIRLGNEIMRWQISNIVHGEQGALNLSTGLADILLDPGAQEYATNQAREEARHVTGFSRYVKVRWGTAYPVGDVLGDLLEDLIKTPVVYKKLVGMQMLLEGLAMGAFANLHKHSRDPVLKRLVQLVMTDEAFHHKFGKIWAEKTIGNLSPEERDAVEDWAAEVFESLLFNLVNIRQKRMIYSQFGLDWEWVREAVRETYDKSERRNELKDGTNVFRVLAKTLISAGIITDRTAHVYAEWVNMKELEAEAHDIPGIAVVVEGIEDLRRINADRKVIGQKF
ncbi:MAG: ferritin-like domain-containing protein [Alphaproteobacteria bacterium]|nr:ferritin-like domain-containing protein [Alphaproteobacteria bacterium]